MSKNKNGRDAIKCGLNLICKNTIA